MEQMIRRAIKLLDAAVGEALKEIPNRPLNSSHIGAVARWIVENDGPTSRRTSGAS
jgi:hypothetical protein